MTIILDANILLRYADAASPLHAVTRAARAALEARGHELRTLPQSLYEFWVAHDARYAAALQAHGLTHLLTFNLADFTRFPGLTLLDPAAAGAAPGGVP